MQRPAILLVLLALVAGLWLLRPWSRSTDFEVLPAPAPAAAPGAASTGGASATSAARTDAGAPSIPAAAAPAAMPEAPTGTLVVRVRSERGDALAGAAVTAGEHAADTDADGAATFTIAARRVFVVVAPPAGVAVAARSGWQNVSAGATTELVVVLPALAPTLFWCRLVAAEDQRPLAGVELREQPVGRVVRSDGDGFVQVLADDGAFLDVAMPGRVPCRVIPMPDHATREQALVVKLELGTTLRAKVVDGGGAPIAGTVLHLEVFAFLLQQPDLQPQRGQPFRWRAVSDAAGQLALADLPRDVSLVVTIEAPVPYAAPAVQTWSFAARDEQRTIVLALAGGVRGRVHDAAGAPVAEVMVQANAATGDRTPRALANLPEAVRAKCAADGSFRLAGLDAGRWWVGLATGAGWQPTVQLVEVVAGRDAEVDITVQPGLVVAGKAFAPDGSAARGVDVELHLDAVLVASAATDAAGAFRFANVPAGGCELRTGPYATDFGLPAPFAATAGDEHIELRLTAIAGRLAGRCVGGSEAWVSAYRRGSDDVFATRCDLDGGFAYEGMRAGTWDIAAGDRHGNTGWLAAVEVAPGRSTAGLLLPLQPGAELRPRHATADAFVIQRGADVVATDALQPGVPGRASVPAGTWTVVFRRADREVARREVTVRAGERLVVDGGS